MRSAIKSVNCPDWTSPVAADISRVSVNCKACRHFLEFPWHNAHRQTRIRMSTLFPDGVHQVISQYVLYCCISLELLSGTKSVKGGKTPRPNDAPAPDNWVGQLASQAEWRDALLTRTTLLLFARHRTWRGENTRLPDCCSRGSLSLGFFISLLMEDSYASPSVIILTNLIWREGGRVGAFLNLQGPCTTCVVSVKGAPALVVCVWLKYSHIFCVICIALCLVMNACLDFQDFKPPRVICRETDRAFFDVRWTFIDLRGGLGQDCGRLDLRPEPYTNVPETEMKTDKVTAHIWSCRQ